MHTSICVWIYSLHLMLSRSLVLCGVDWDRPKTYIGIPCYDAIGILGHLWIPVPVVWDWPFCLLFDWWSHIWGHALSLPWNRSRNSLSICSIILVLTTLNNSLCYTIRLFKVRCLLTVVKIDYMSLELNIVCMVMRDWIELLGIWWYTNTSLA